MSEVPLYSSKGSSGRGWGRGIPGGWLNVIWEMTNEKMCFVVLSEAQLSAVEM